MTTRQKALVVEGGAMRGIFAAGVLDQFIESAFYDFHFCVGVSAGSTNLIGYLSDSYSRSKRIILNYATSAEFFQFLSGTSKEDTCVMCLGFGTHRLTRSR